MNTPAKRLAKCRQFDCDTQVEQRPLPFGSRLVWVPQLCAGCQAIDAKVRKQYTGKTTPTTIDRET